MLIIYCPFCAMDRPESEFRYAGEAHVVRPEEPAALDDAQWVDFLYHRANARGVHAERWRHVHGCGRFLNVLRDTVSDRILATYRPGAARPEVG
jgi:sarcosine oxidase subunit delta